MSSVAGDSYSPATASTTNPPSHDHPFQRRHIQAKPTLCAHSDYPHTHSNLRGVPHFESRTGWLPCLLSSRLFNATRLGAWSTVLRVPR
jgi:hypothetical protein